MRIQSLKEYVLVSTDTPKVEDFRRPARGHRQREEARAGETIRILEATIHVDDVYRRTSA